MALYSTLIYLETKYQCMSYFVTNVNCVHDHVHLLFAECLQLSPEFKINLGMSVGVRNLRQRLSGIA